MAVKFDSIVAFVCDTRHQSLGNSEKLQACACQACQCAMAYRKYRGSCKKVDCKVTKRWARLEGQVSACKAVTETVERPRGMNVGPNWQPINCVTFSCLLLCAKSLSLLASCVL